ncbi:MAG: hypothetical protein ACI83I_002973, partial [Bacteroidia bacterium]
TSVVTVAPIFALIGVITNQLRYRTDHAYKIPHSAGAKFTCRTCAPCRNMRRQASAFVLNATKTFLNPNHRLVKLQRIKKSNFINFKSSYNE